jgi:hypothetical protein
LLVQADSTYRTKRDKDSDGNVLPGVRYARNAVVHGDLVVSTFVKTLGSQLGAMQLGVSQLGTVGSTHWQDRASIPYIAPAHKYVPRQEQSYDAEIAGKGIMPPLTQGLRFLRTAAGT